jgi:DNA-binding beta-propeller fold protein YncE
MDKARLGGFAVLIAATAAGACGGRTNGAAAPRDARSGASGTGACTAKSEAEPLGRTGAGATLALAKIGGRRVAFVADEDARSILTLDVESRLQLAETPLGGTPAQVYVGTDGRVFVALRDKSELAVLTAESATAPLTRRCSVGTPAEPIAIAGNGDDSTVVVTSGWGQRLTAYDGKSLAQRFDAKIAREPRSVVVSDDGKSAFVSHAVGSIMSVVDLEGSKHETKQIALRGFAPGELKEIDQRRKNIEKTGKTDADAARIMQADFDSEESQKARLGRPSCQGFALAKSSAVPGRIFAPEVMVDPGDPERRPDGYGDENQQTEAPAVAVVDEGSKEAMPSSLTLGREAFMLKRSIKDQRDPRPECLLPRAATIDPKTKSLLVTCYGIDAVIAYDAASGNPLTSERRRWTVGSGPSGIAIDAEKHRAVVWSQFDRTLTTFPIGGTELVDDKTSPPLVQKTAMAPLNPKLPAEYALGRILFHAAGDTRISSDGRACASCHPDGRDDAITWATPEGPRRSIMLAGRVTRTAPYSWNGNETTLHNHLGNTFDRLSGKGLRSIELDALVTYLSSMPAPAPEVVEKVKADRGKQIFASAEAGCAGCHSGESYSDGKNHDIGSKHKFDREASFNTPSLHLVGGTGPYFHDGRYSTLGELLKKSDGKMGKTAHLSPADLDALETFLRTL